MEKNNNTKKLILGICLLVVFIGGLTYGLWALTHVQSQDNVYKTGCLNIRFIEESDEINITDAVPITDEEGLAQEESFDFTIQNTCEFNTSYEVYLEVLPSTTLGSNNSVSYALDQNNAHVLGTKPKTNATIAGATSFVIGSGVLNAASSHESDDGGSRSYSLRLWLNDNSNPEDMRKQFFGKIVVAGTME